MYRLAFISFALAVFANSASAEAVAGRVSIINGDTTRPEGQEIRLLGIDAPQSMQICWDAAGQEWPSGRRAALALSDKIGRAILVRNGMRRDRERRPIAVCQTGTENLNAWLVAKG